MFKGQEGTGDMRILSGKYSIFICVKINKAFSIKNKDPLCLNT